MTCVPVSACPYRQASTISSVRGTIVLLDQQMAPKSTESSRDIATTPRVLSDQSLFVATVYISAIRQPHRILYIVVSQQEPLYPHVMTDKPIRLVTVNTAPERAKRLIGRVVEDVKDRYIIVHAANVERIEDVRPTLEQERPDLLFTASMWSAEQVQEIVTIARDTIPGIKIFNIPFGLQVEKGPDAVVEYIEEHLPGVLATGS
ncbi:hypothetical protein C8Q77DRAFT_1143557 [Trametes polyzona]|nr:hypothetical protein C8Q77DRAFT_1143557 [Trametes polyzona]